MITAILFDISGDGVHVQQHDHLIEISEQHSRFINLSDRLRVHSQISRTAGAIKACKMGRHSP